MNKTTAPNKVLIGIIGLLFISSAFGVMIISPRTLADSELSDMDLSISGDAVVFSNINPVEGDVVTISAQIHGDEGEFISTQNSELIFSDGFESGFENWGLTAWNPTGTLEIINRPVNSGTQSLHAQSDPYTNTGPYVYRMLGSSYDTILAETMIYLPEKTQAFNQLVLLRTAAIGADGTAYNINLMLDNDNYGLDVLEYYYNPSGVFQRNECAFDIVNFNPNQWYSIAIQADDNSFSVLVNGETFFEGARNDDLNFYAIYMGDTKGSSGGWGDAYWDDVNVWTLSEIPSYTIGLDAECTVSFYLNSISESNLIGRQNNVFVPADQDITVEAEWASIAGEHEIIVDITNVNPMDSDMANNMASAPIIVGELPQIEEVDLSIYGQDITFSDINPVEGDAVVISATIHGDEGEFESSQNNELIFSDNFETGNLNKWVKSSWNPSGVLEVTSEISDSPPYSMHAQSDPYTNTGPYVLKYLDDTYSHVIVETSFYLPAKTQMIDIFDIMRIGSSQGTILSTTTYEFYVILRDDDYSIDLIECAKDMNGVWSYNYPAQDIIELTPGVWHDISIELTETCYTLIVDNSAVAMGQRAASTSLHHLILGDEGGSGGGWGNAYWDDVNVWYLSEESSFIPGQDAECTVSFYLDSISESNLIDCQDNVFVPAGQNITVETEWASIAGTHEIIVDVTNVNPLDFDMANNMASATIIVEELPQIEEVDLSIYDQDITFSVTNLVEGDSLEISAIVHGDYGTSEESTTQTIIFEDDFESGNLNKWELSYWNPSGLLEVTDSESHSESSYSMHAQSYPYINTGPWVAKLLDDEYEHIKGETWFYLPEKVQEYEYLDIMRLSSISEDWTGGNYITDYNLMIKLHDDDYSIDIIETANDDYGVAQVYYRGWDIYELTPLTWHKIANEIDGNQFTISVDDNIIFQGTRNSNIPIDFLFIGDPGGSGGGGGDAYWDDVNIWSVSEESSIISGLDAECTVSFYLDSISESNLINRQNNVLVPAGQDITVETEWTSIAGTHQVIVDVSNVVPQDCDLTNNVATASIEVVAQVQNQLPVAEAGPDKTALALDEIMFDANGSYDPDGTIVSYVWDFGDESVAEGFTVAHTYAVSGNYLVTLTVTDDSGETVQDTCFVDVLAPNQLPVAEIGPGKTTVIDAEVLFDGSGSYDPDGTIVSYVWDFGDDVTATGQTPVHSYSSKGNYTVILTVTDDAGATGIDSCQVEVTCPCIIVPKPSNITIVKVKTVGPDIVETHTRYGWELQITVTNGGGSNASGIVVYDVLPAELMLNGHAMARGNFTYAQNGGGLTGSTRLEWRLGLLEPGEQEVLTLWISTRPNPAGQQEFTSPGNYSLNDGAWLVGIDDLTGEPISAGPTDPIYVTAIDISLAEAETEIISPIVEPDSEEKVDINVIESIIEQMRNSLSPVLIDVTTVQNAELDSEDINSGGAFSLNGLLPAMALILLVSIISITMIMKRNSGTELNKKELDVLLVNGEISESEYLRMTK